MPRRLLIGVLLSCLLNAAPLLADEAAAKQAAESWLAMHDEGRYDETWEASAQFVKDKLTQDKWRKLMQSAAAPLGKVKSRSLHGSTPTDTLPGMPDGKYVVFEYKTEFENKKSAIETVIPMLEDGTWKVMTYRIR